MTSNVEKLTIASRFALAAAIAYLAYAIAGLVANLPQISQTLSKITEQTPATLETVENVRTEVSQIRELVPDILAEAAAIRQQVPEVVEEVGQVRQSLPAVLEELAETRRDLPSLLERVDKTVAVVDQTQRQIPNILESANRATASIDDTREQIETLTPQVLTEIRLTREEIDPALNRIDAMINDAYGKAQETVRIAQDAGQEASEGAIKGIVTGILKLPFRLTGSLASPLIKNIEPDVARLLTQKDVELMGEAANRLSESRKLNQPEYWRNPRSRNAGSISLVRRFEFGGAECVEAAIVIDISGRTAFDQRESFCRNADGKWVSAPLPGKKK